MPSFEIGLGPVQFGFGTEGKDVDSNAHNKWVRNWSERQFGMQMDWSREQFNKNMLWQKYLYNNQFKDMVNNARSMGINPLAALGANVHSPVGNIHGGGMPSTSASGALHPSISKYQSTMMKIDLAKAWEELKALKNVNNDTVVSSTTVPSVVVDQAEGAVGGTHAQWKVVQDAGVFDVEAIDQNEFEDAPTRWFRTEGRKLINIARASLWDVLPRAGKVYLVDYVQSRRKILNTIRPLPKGMTYKFDHRAMGFKVVPDDGGIIIGVKPFKMRKSGLREKSLMRKTRNYFRNLPDITW